MTQRTPKAEPKRSYDGTRRREQAQRNRERMLDAAEQRFLRDGYASTTVASIATEASVSADLLYKSFGGKPGLVRAIRTRALEGRGPVPAEERSDALHDQSSDARQIIAAWGRLTAEVAPRVAPILLLIRAAATADAEVRALAEELDDERLRRMTDNARRLREGGHLRAGITTARAADVLWTYSAPELYELLVLRRGWSTMKFGRFVAEAMIDALL